MAQETKTRYMFTPVWKIDTAVAVYIFCMVTGLPFDSFILRFHERRREELDADAVDIQMIDFNLRYHQEAQASATKVILDVVLPRLLAQGLALRVPNPHALAGMSQMLEMLERNNNTGYLKKLSLRTIRKDGASHSVRGFLDFAWLIRMIDAFDFPRETCATDLEEHVRKYYDRFLAVIETYFQVYNRPEGPSLNPAAFVRFVEKQSGGAFKRSPFRKLEPWMHGGFMDRPEALLTVPGYILARFEIERQIYGDDDLLYAALVQKLGFWWGVFENANKVEKNAQRASKTVLAEIQAGTGPHHFFDMPDGRRGLYVDPKNDRVTKYLWKGLESFGLRCPNVIVSRVELPDGHWITAVLSRSEDAVDFQYVSAHLQMAEDEVRELLGEPYVDIPIWHYETRPGHQSVMNGSGSILHAPMTVLPPTRIVGIVQHHAVFGNKIVASS